LSDSPGVRHVDPPAARGAADPTRRFSSRVSDYARYRPRYPAGLIEALVRRTGLRPSWIIADIGCGTGLSAEPFLENGNTVFGVEPNPDMRNAAAVELARFPQFRAIGGSAEAPPLAPASVDVVISGQAFHWFDSKRALTEFRRIVRRGGPIVILWNTRRTSGSAPAEAFEAIVQRFGTDYGQVRHDRFDEERMRGVFGGECERLSIQHVQDLDFETLRGRLASMSFLPAAGDPARDLMLAALDEAWEKNAEGSVYRLDYETEIYIGR
jgi:SAM-dependent methyltransferase